jgi:hypothetical protein
MMTVRDMALAATTSIIRGLGFAAGKLALDGYETRGTGTVAKAGPGCAYSRASKRSA